MYEGELYISVTNIIPLHKGNTKTLIKSLSERLDYGMNHDKTNNGQLISSFACDPHTVEAEFLLSKQRYEQITGRQEKNSVIAYQVRQSFKPGEVTPEEANQIGYEFASRFLKDKHAFIVCTHVDKKHIHNHIYWNSTTLDCTRKFRNFRNSTQAIAHLSDLICIEHQLSVVADPQNHSKSYDKWMGDRSKTSNRKILRSAIDTALSKKPRDFDSFLSLLEDEGFTFKESKYLTVCHKDFKQNIRVNSLGEGYTEEDLRAIIIGQKTHTPKKRKGSYVSDRPQIIIDIQAKFADGKGEAYRRWATLENLKRMAKTKLYMDEHGLDYDQLALQKENLNLKQQELSAKIDSTQKRLAEINTLKTHIVNYIKTKDVYVEYRKSGYSKKYLTEHEDDIIIHKASKKAFDELNMKKLPTIKSLQIEFAEILKEKKSAYAELRKVRHELRELSIHKANYEELRNLVASENKSHDSRNIPK